MWKWRVADIGEMPYNGIGLAGGERKMQDKESPFVRYRRLACECLDVANTFARADQRDVFLQMAQVWQRLADQYANSTPPFFQAGSPEQPVMQQQQQVQSEDEKKS
jgi:hypothetical protein